jgi:hypothetical protein
MKEETSNTATSSSSEFSVPIDLLKSFKGNVRFMPINPGTKGYIMFDRAMLIAALKSSNTEERMNIANQLENMGKARGELVIIEKSATL